MLAHAVEVLNPSATPPFQLDDDNLSESVRLEHRVLDLRREPMQRNLRLRHRAAAAARRFLDAQGFVDIETPVLYKSTPEGAREFLVPSRLHDGHFYALPQSPQLFKQMLMIAGFDRYYQIVKCFRDEDLRADRQPEFTQIDIETSFMDEDAIRAMMEAAGAHHVPRNASASSCRTRSRCMTYDDAMRDYGSDKPDLRVPLKFTELTDVMKDVDFKVFSAPANAAGGRVAALRVPGGGTLTRGEIDVYTEYVRVARRQGPRLDQGQRARGRRGGAAVADRQEPARRRPGGDSRAQWRAGRRPAVLRRRSCRRSVNESLGALRQRVGHERGLSRPGWWPLWVVDFPMFEFDEDVEVVEGAAPSVHQSEGRARGVHRVGPGACLPRRPTTWCSTAGRSAAARCGSTARRCSSRCSAR